MYLSKYQVRHNIFHGMLIIFLTIKMQCSGDPLIHASECSRHDKPPNHAHTSDIHEQYRSHRKLNLDSANEEAF